MKWFLNVETPGKSPKTLLIAINYCECLFVISPFVCFTYLISKIAWELCMCCCGCCCMAIVSLYIETEREKGNSLNFKNFESIRWDLHWIELIENRILYLKLVFLFESNEWIDFLSNLSIRFTYRVITYVVLFTFFSYVRLLPQK